MYIYKNMCKELPKFAKMKHISRNFEKKINCQYNIKNKAHICIQAQQFTREKLCLIVVKFLLWDNVIRSSNLFYTRWPLQQSCASRKRSSAYCTTAVILLNWALVDKDDRRKVAPADLGD